MDVPQCPTLSLLHHHPDGLVIAFKIPLHSPEHPGLGGNGVQSADNFPHFLFQFFPAFCPGGLAEGIAGNGVVRRGHVLPGGAKLGSALVQFCPRLFPAGGSGIQIPFQLLQPLPGLLTAFLQTPDICLSPRNVRGEGRFLSPQLQILPGNALGIGGQRRQLLLAICQLLPLLFQQLLDFSDPVVGLLDLGGNAAAAILLPLQLFLNPGDIAPIVIHIAPQNRHLAVQLLVGGAEHVHLHPDGFQLLIPAVQGLCQFLGLTVEAVQIVMGLLQNKGGGGVVLFRLFRLGGKLFQGVQPHGYLHALQFFLQFQVLFCLLRLSLQRLQLQFQLGDLVADAKQVVLGVLQLLLRLLFPVTVLGNARGLLENLPAVAAFQGKYLIDTPLADVGVALLAQAGVHEQLIDIPEPGRLLIDIVFPVTAAVIPAGDHHLVGIIGQRPVGVVQGQGGLGKAYGSPLLGAAEDHVLHFRASQRFGALLAQHPQNGIGNIRLA